jgi:calcium permeable stress-gated cation channel
MSSTTTAASAASTTSSSATATTTPGAAQTSSGITLVAFLTALATSLVVFGVQMFFFLLLRNKLARILYDLPYLVFSRPITD